MNAIMRCFINSAHALSILALLSAPSFADKFAWTKELLPVSKERCRIRAENVADRLRDIGFASKVNSQFQTAVVLNGLGGKKADAIILCQERQSVVMIIVYADDVQDALGFRDRIRNMWRNTDNFYKKQ